MGGAASQADELGNRCGLYGLIVGEQLARIHGVCISLCDEATVQREERGRHPLAPSDCTEID